METENTYRFGGFTLDLRRGLLIGGEQPVALRPKVFQLLTCLVLNAGRVMSKDELIETVWPDVTVTEDSLSQCVGELRRVLGDGPSGTLVKTVPRRGYMFDGSAIQDSNLPTTAGVPAPAIGEGKPSIAVLPFRNLSSDPEQDYFADGVVEEITTALGHFRQIVVISRNSAFTFKGQTVGGHEVGAALGVRYLLGGSVRKSGDRLRLTAHLTDAQSGIQLWANQYDGYITDVFAFQDEVTRMAIGAIAPRLLLAEQERLRRKRPDNFGAYELYLRALDGLRTMIRQDNDDALAAIGRALELEPDYAVAAGLGAWAHTIRVAQGWDDVLREQRAVGLELARRALAAGQDDSEALSYAGYAVGVLGEELRAGVRAINRAVAMNPNSALALTNGGWLKTYLGDSEDAIRDYMSAKSLSPRDPGLYRLNTGLSFALILERNYTAAVEAGREAIEANLNYVPAHRALAASLALVGQREEARKVIEHLLYLNPRTTVASTASRSLMRFSGKLGLVLEGLRLAGLPE
jgi:adenylate cyclase